jgi:hypothetical protein
MHNDDQLDQINRQGLLELWGILELKANHNAQ